MPRGYLDEMIPVNSGILGQYISPVGPFREPMYAMVDNDTVAVTPAPTRTRSNKPKKKKSNKPKNDGIIRNHDSVWDYKIENGKLLTRRKTSDGKWYDITSNDEARTRIESFTGRTINKTTNTNSSHKETKSSSTNNNSNSTNKANIASPSEPVAQQAPVRPQKSIQSTKPVVTQDTTRPANNTRVDTLPKPANNANSNVTNTNVANTDYFGKDLPEVTVTAQGNPRKRETGLIRQEDLDANGWRWGMPSGNPDINPYNDLFKNAVEKGAEQGAVLVDSNGKIVPTSTVNKYISRGRIPMYVSDYDAQFWQPQTESKPHEVRMAELQRWVRDFDRQRNIGLATMFGLPVLAASTATAPITTIGAIAGGELLNSGAKAAGVDWDKWAGGNDPTAQMYAGMINPFRLAGNIAGGMGGSYAEPYVASAVNAGKATINPVLNKLPKPDVKGVRLSLAMNKALSNKKLNAQDKAILKESVPYLFEPIRKTPFSITRPLNYGPYNYMNPALAENMIAGPYPIPNYTNGIPFGVPLPRNLWGEMNWLPPDLLNRNSNIPYLNI